MEPWMPPTMFYGETVDHYRTMPRLASNPRTIPLGDRDLGPAPLALGRLTGRLGKLPVPLALFPKNQQLPSPTMDRTFESASTRISRRQTRPNLIFPVPSPRTE